MLLFFGSEFLTTLAGDYGFLYSIACLALNYNSYYAFSKSFCDFSDSFLSSASLITYNGITFDLRTYPPSADAFATATYRTFISTDESTWIS